MTQHFGGVSFFHKTRQSSWVLDLQTCLSKPTLRHRTIFDDLTTSAELKWIFIELLTIMYSSCLCSPIFTYISVLFISFFTPTFFSSVLLSGKQPGLAKQFVAGTLLQSCDQKRQAVNSRVFCAHPCIYPHSLVNSTYSMHLGHAQTTTPHAFSSTRQTVKSFFFVTVEGCFPSELFWSLKQSCLAELFSFHWP